MSYSIKWKYSSLFHSERANLGIYIRQMSFCHNMKETLSSNTFEKVYKWQDICKMYSCIHSNTQLHFYIPHTKESCIKVSKMSLRQISWKKSLERLTGWWLIFHIFISQWMLLQAVVCMCAHKYFYVLWTIEFSDIIVISSRFTI